MQRFSLSIGVAASFFLWAPAQGRSLEQQWAYCSNPDGRFPVDAVIRGCTLVIESAGATPRDLAIAYTSRGNAYLRIGAMDRAIPDFNRAIEINGQPGRSSPATPRRSIATAGDADFNVPRIRLNRDRIASYYRRRGKELGDTAEAQQDIAKAEELDSQIAAGAASPH